MRHSVSSLDSVVLYRRWEPVRLMVNLSNVHQNINFTSDRVYFLNGTAFDFYSSDELEKQKGPADRWRIFPLPNELALRNATPWQPRSQQKSIEIPLPLETSTGLPFVDYVFIATRPNLTDRQDNLRRILTRDGITNYEWRQKWVRDTCYAPQNKDEVVRKLNLRPKHRSETIFHRVDSSLHCHSSSFSHAQIHTAMCNHHGAHRHLV